LYSIGIDLGGTNIAGGIVDAENRIIVKKSVPTLSERPWETVLDDMAKLCGSLIKSAGLKRENISHIGFGVPGAVDPKYGILAFACNLNVRDQPLKAQIERLTGIPAFLENDANAAALGEYLAGAAVGADVCVIVTLGTGIGGGIIAGGKVLGGSNNGAGEIGHMCIKVGGLKCSCGRLGCFEAYASASGLIAMARRAAKQNPESLMRKIAGPRGAIMAKTVFEAMDQGDGAAHDVFKDYVRYLAEGLANLVNIFDPDMIIIGGGISKQGERLLIPVRAETAKLVYGGELRAKIVSAKLGNDAGIIGAARLQARG